MTTELFEKPDLRVLSSQPSPTYHVRVIDSLDAFAALQPEWDAFLRQADAANLCITHAWLHTWLTEFPPDNLLIMIVTDETGAWQGLAPLKISRGRNGLAHRLLRHLQFVGTQPTVYDWMKLVIAPMADESAVIAAMAQAIQASHWDVLDLQFMPDDGQVQALCAHLNVSTEKSLRPGMPIPYLDLPDTEAEYEKSRRKKTRLEVNRHRNRFAKEFSDPLVMEFQPSSDAANAALNRFFAGHIKYWADKGHKSDFERFPQLTRFYQRMLQASDPVSDPRQPKLLFSVLKVGDEQLSYHLGFWQGESYLSHLTHFNQGYRSYSPGTIHMDALVFETIRRGGKLFDFGRGDEPYKKMWTQTRKPLWNLRIFRNPLSQLVWSIDTILKKLLGKPTA